MFYEHAFPHCFVYKDFVFKKMNNIPIYTHKATVLCDVIMFPFVQVILKCFYVNMHISIFLCCGMQMHWSPTKLHCVVGFYPYTKHDVCQCSFF